ncbi:MAG: hypothetical protein R2867_28760, partial [Caldilineaceae bacterium]
VAQKIIDYLEHRLQNFHPTAISIPARKRDTPNSPDDPQIAAPIFQSNYLFMGPGSPTYAARQLCNSYAWHAMVARHRLGAALCFSSASTLAISTHTIPVYEIYKVGQDLHWQQGLDFFGYFGIPMVIVPHWNNSDGGEDLDTSHCYLGAARYEALLAILPSPATVLGIEENTGLIIQPTAGICEVIGVGGVVIVRNGEETRYNNRDQFPVDALGDWSLPTYETLPAQVWRDAQALYNSVAETTTPPAEVVTLAQARAEARESKDWAKADRIRDQLAEQGWQVNDTPDGPELSRITD